MLPNMRGGKLGVSAGAPPPCAEASLPLCGLERINDGYKLLQKKLKQSLDQKIESCNYYSGVSGHCTHTQL